MTAHVLQGSKREIAEGLVRIHGEVREAIVFVDDGGPEAPAMGTTDPGDVFAEMHALMVDVPHVDDSREAIYSRTDGE